VEIHQREKEGIGILDMKGRLVVGPASARVREAISSLSGPAGNRVILNLKEVDYIDSTGLGTLVVCFTSLQKAGGALKLTSLNKRNLELLVLTKLSTIFELFNDEQEAVNSFFPDREIKRFDILSFIQDQQE